MRKHLLPTFSTCACGLRTRQAGRKREVEKRASSWLFSPPFFCQPLFSKATCTGRTFLLGLVIALPYSTGLTASAVDISGTWNFSVDLEDGGHGDPTFVFKQEGEKLTGTYSGPLGEQKVTGTVTGDQAVFGFEFKNDDQTLKATYTGKIESATKMTGTVEFTGGPRGKWTATKKGS